MSLKKIKSESWALLYGTKKIFRRESLEMQEKKTMGSEGSKTLKNLRIDGLLGPKQRVKTWVKGGLKSFVTCQEKYYYAREKREFELGE